MIKRLILKRFGKFSGRILEFSPFTVITGPNETGKTTIFDALFENLCGGQRRGDIWMRLNERYGKDRESSLELAAGSEPVSFDAQEFLEIFAVRGGDIGIDAAGGAAWFDAAKNSLLTAGLDPAEIASRLAKEGTENKGYAPIRARTALEGEITELGSRLREYLNKREQALSGESGRKKLEAEAAELKARLSAREEELEKVRPQYEASLAGAELAGVRKALDTLRELDEARARGKALEGFAAGKIAEYDAIIADAGAKKNAIGVMRGGLAEREKFFGKLKAGMEAERASLPGLERRAAAAAALASQIDVFQASPAVQPRQGTGGPLLFGFCAAGAVLGAFLYYRIGGAAGLLAGAAAAAAVCAALWLAAYRRSGFSAGPEEAKREFLARLSDSWRNSGFDSELLKRDTLEGTREALARLALEARAAADKLAAHEKEAGEAAAGISSGADSAGILEKEIAELEARARAWLADNGCASRDEYIKNAAESANAAAALARLAAEAEALMRTRGEGSEKKLRGRLLDEKDSLEKKAAASYFSEAKAKSLKLEYERLRGEIETLKSDFTGREAALQGARNLSAGRLEGLPEAINALTVDIAGKKSRVEDINLSLEACRLASKVFSEIASGSSAQFMALGAEVADALSGGPVRFASFELDGVFMADAGGTERPVARLSTGTRDLFMLGARLALARKARKDRDGRVPPALLVLDEPFLSFDGGRTGTALKLLAAFQKETDWQIIVLTKDPGVAQAAGAAGVQFTEIALS